MLAAVALGLALGVALAAWLAGGPWPLLALPLLWCLRKRPWLMRALTLALLLGPASWWATLRAPVMAPDDIAGLAPRRFIRIEGIVATPPTGAASGWKAELVISRPRPGRVIATWPADRRPMVGERWEMAGRLRRPRGPGNPGEFDYPAFLARRGIYATFQGEEGQARGPAPGWWGAHQLDRLRMGLLAGLGSGLSPAHAALLGSLVLGAGAAPVDETTATNFRRVGLSHLLAASGSQVGLLAGVLYAGLSACRVPPAWAAGLTAPWLLVYLGLTGAPPGMQRATLMGLVALGGLASERRSVPYAALWLSVVVMLLASPECLYDLGWQFSVLATFSLVRLARWMESARPAGPAWLWGSLLVPIVAYAWVTPWQLATFQVWSVWALPANWLAAPLIALLTPWSMGVAVLGMAVPGVAALANQATALALRVLEVLVGALAGLPGAELTAASPGVMALMLIYAALACGWRYRLPALACLALAGLAWQAPAPAGELQLAFLSVGQGDAVALRTPGGAWVVIDAGPAWDGGDAGTRTVLPALRRWGCDRLDLMVASHAHADHVGGLPALVGALPVAEAWDAGQDESSASPLLASWLVRGVPWAIAHPRLVWERDGVRLEAIAPRRRAISVNDGSIVLRVRYGTFTALLCGDLEAEGERDLLASGESLGCDVLKVGHHGSKTSSTPAWVAATAPQLAVVSVGVDNRFRHPAASVITRWRASGAIVERTDVAGAVVVRSNGHRWRYGTRLTDWRPALAPAS